MLWVASAGAGDSAADQLVDQKLSRVQDKVRASGGRVVDSTTLWCTVCRHKVPLHQPHSVQSWTKHTDKEVHKGAFQLIRALPVMECGSAAWLAKRKHAWREALRVKKVNRAAALQGMTKNKMCRTWGNPLGSDVL